MSRLSKQLQDIDEGIKEVRKVYIMEFKFKTKSGGYRTLHKIGVAKDPLERMLQVARSVFQAKRYVPECRLVKYRKCTDFFEIESKLHRMFSASNYKFSFVFDGCTEYFTADIEDIVEAYEEMLPLVTDKVLVDKAPK